LLIQVSEWLHPGLEVYLLRHWANELGGDNVNLFHAAEDWATIRARMEEPVELDVWRAANLLVHQFGDEAETFAAHWADLALDADDPDGQFVRSWIKRAVVELQALEETRH
jgi:hypothetical protein